MYELNNSINWHMYFFKPQVDVKVFYFKICISFNQVTRTVKSFMAVWELMSRLYDFSDVFFFFLALNS